jgi:hypothetical protein
MNFCIVGDTTLGLSDVVIRDNHRKHPLKIPRMFSGILGLSGAQPMGVATKILADGVLGKNGGLHSVMTSFFLCLRFNRQCIFFQEVGKWAELCLSRRCANGKWMDVSAAFPHF